MFKKNPIFIIGSHKSGSSLLRSLLDNHPELYTLPHEIHYFQYTGNWVDYRLRYTLPTSMNREELIDNLIKRVKQKNNHADQYADSILVNKFDIQEFSDYLRRHQADNEASLFKTYVEALHLSLMHKELPEEKHIVEKSVENAEFAAFIKNIFPSARFIHIIRNPYATLTAIRKSKTKKHYPHLKDFILSLQNSYSNLFKNKKLLDDYLVIRYEDLLQSTSESMQMIADFLNIEYTDSLLEPTTMGEPWKGNSSSSNNRSFNKISTAPLTNWKHQITDLEIQLVNDFFGPVVEEFKYEKKNPKNPNLLPIKNEGIRTFIKNRSLLWLKPSIQIRP